MRSPLRLVVPLASMLVVGMLLTACGDGASVADQRATDARAVAVDAGLDEDIADFLALAAQGPSATYQVTYPGPDDGTRVVVASRGADRRIDLIANGTITDVQLVVDGETFVCPRDPASGGYTCDKTDAFVDAPGQFSADTIDALTESLRQGLEDYTFTVEAEPIAGVDAQCLVTRIRSGQERSDLGASGTLCVSGEGAVLRVDRSGETLTAVDYSTDVPDNVFERPDQSEPIP